MGKRPLRAALIFAIIAASPLSAQGAPAKGAKAKAPAPPTAAPAGNPARGSQRFQAICGTCHMALRDASLNDERTKIGPNLYGVVGRTAGTHKGYSYSPAMKKSGIVWTKEALRPYITAPQKTIPSVRMSFAGLADQTDVTDIIAYLATLK